MRTLSYTCRNRETRLIAKNAKASYDGECVFSIEGKKYMSAAGAFPGDELEIIEFDDGTFAVIVCGIKSAASETSSKAAKEVKGCERNLKEHNTTQNRNLLNTAENATAPCTRNTEGSHKENGMDVYRDSITEMKG